MNKKTIIALVALVVVVGLLIGVYFLTRPETEEGMKTITVTVVHSDKTEKTVTIKTDKTYLFEAMVDEGLLKAEDNENGLYNTVDGETADWNENEAWWALYEGDTQTNEGMNTLPIKDGGTYKVEYKIGFDGF